MRYRGTPFPLFALLAAALPACISSQTPNPFVLVDGGLPDGSIPPFDASGFDATGWDGRIPFDASFLDAALPDAPAPHDAGIDTTVPPSDAGSTGDAAADAGADADAATTPPTVYNDMTSGSFWSTFDTTTVSSGARGFEGATFDGQYIYLAPYNHGTGTVVARYDTRATFDAGASWQTFDIASTDAGARGFAGAAFDGKYVYLAPRAGNGNVVMRYNTQSGFGDAGSWDSFTTTTFDAGTATAADGFVGAVFDGRYVYFVPYNNANNAYHGVIARYDTQQDFKAQASWSAFDTSTKDPKAKGFYGGVFDGQYLYLIPWINGTADGGGSSYDGVVARYNTQLSFTDTASWTTFDTQTLDGGPVGFGGGAFDGRYLYLVPSLSGTFVRFDTQATFAAASSWSTFDSTPLDAGTIGFTGATFDGRFLYFAPYYNTGYDGVVTRFDTASVFEDAGSWSTFNAAGANASSVGFIGTVFDGHSVYFVPCCNGSSSYTGTVTRFESKTPASMPNLYGDSGVKFSGSFL